MNKFHFQTPNRTINSLQAQQIYYEWVKLKKYLKLNTLGGKKIIPSITFKRVQLPMVGYNQVIDMEGYFYKHNPRPKALYYTAFMMCGYAIGYYIAQGIYDEDTKYYASVRYPMPMRHFEITIAYLKSLFISYKLLFPQIEEKEWELLMKQNLLERLESLIYIRGLKILYGKQMRPKLNNNRPFQNKKKNVINFELFIESDVDLGKINQFLEQQDKEIIKNT